MAYLGLGSNMGDRRGNLARALQALAGYGRIDAVSSVYTSEPVGYADQPWFWNLVFRLRTRLDAHDLLAASQQVEADLGRRPSRRNRPRPIDVDLLLYGEESIRSPDLIVPHPSIMDRAFVLRPLTEIDPGLVHPGTGEKFAHRLGTGRFERSRRLFDGRTLLKGIVAALLAVSTIACAGNDAERRRRELAMLVDSLLPRLERLSGLEARDSVQVALRTPAEVRRYVEQRLDEEMPPAVLESIHAVYALLGLVPDSLSLRDLLLDLYTEQIAGYYDPVTRVLYIVEGATAPAVRPVMAHELVHALQDQHAPLDSLIHRSRGNDRQMAAQAALEGHATLVMFALLAEDVAGEAVDVTHLPDPGEQLRAAFESSDSDFPVFRSAPDIIRETLLFPYLAGASFVRLLWQSGAMDRRATAPLGVWLPQSTEQVMDPAGRFTNFRDDPVELRFTTVPRWRTVYENTLGAFETRVLLDAHARPAALYGSGWDGDRYVLLDGEGGARALVWVSVWDDARARDAFATALRSVVSDGALPAAGFVESLDVDGRAAVRLVLARGVDPHEVGLPAVYCADEQGSRMSCPPPDTPAANAADGAGRELRSFPGRAAPAK